ncbi:MAG TPA: serine kinase [Phycisphaerae bacterium]|nr:serine kinase [Phycisphaerae bacterium]
MKVSQLAAKAGLNSLSEYNDREAEGVYISDMVSDIITGAKANNILITLQTHKSLIAAANLVDVAAVVFARGRTPSSDTVQLGRNAGIALFVTDADTWSFAVKLNEIGIR